MKASELAAKLEDSGTGKSKLDAALRLVAVKKNPQGQDLLKALHDLGHHTTVQRGMAILGLKELPEFSTPTEVKKLSERLAMAELERDELRKRVEFLEGETLGPKAV